MYRRFLDALILVEMLALNCVLKDSLKRMRMDGGSINICRSKDLTLSNSSKASFSSLVISSSRDSIPPSPAATFTTHRPSQICETQLAEDCPDQRHGVDYGNCTCAGSDQGPQSVQWVHVYFLGLTLVTWLVPSQLWTETSYVALVCYNSRFWDS